MVMVLDEIQGCKYHEYRVYVYQKFMRPSDLKEFQGGCAFHKLHLAIHNKPSFVLKVLNNIKK